MKMFASEWYSGSYHLTGIPEKFDKPTILRAEDGSILPHRSILKTLSDVDYLGIASLWVGIVCLCAVGALTGFGTAGRKGKCYMSCLASWVATCRVATPCPNK